MIHLHHPGLLDSVNESKRVTDFHWLLCKCLLVLWRVWCSLSHSKQQATAAVNESLPKSDFWVVEWVEKPKTQKLNESYKLIKDFPRIIMISPRFSRKQNGRRKTPAISSGVQCASIFSGLGFALHMKTETKISNLAIFFLFFIYFDFWQH